MSKAVTVEQIDGALKRYYTKFQREYNNIFSEWYAENGFEDLQDEMGNGPEEPDDCLLLDFDEDFPFVTEPDDREAAICKLMWKIYENPNCDFRTEMKSKEEIKNPKENETESKENDQSEIEEIDDLLSTMNLNGSSGLESHCKTALFYHKDCLLHKPGNNRPHVERPERCSRSYQMLKQYGLLSYLMEITAREATEEELKGSHTPSLVKRCLSVKGNGWFDSDTFYNMHSARAAKLAAGATIDVMAGILEGKFENGFALVRPPGHHCEQGTAMGFCLFNNAVVAVNEIRRRGLCTKALIIDWDVHHGNGIQNMFYDDNDVLYFSVHRYDGGYFYPGTGHAKDTGEGFNVNVPLDVSTDEGHGNKQYLLIWKDILLPMVREFKPDIILISAGFDACIGDPLGGMRVTPPCYGLMTRLLLNECSNLAIVLEGGYNLETMPRAIVCCHYALLKGPKKQKDAYDVDEFYKEFKQNIDDKESFHQWLKQYGKLLIEKDYNQYAKMMAKKRQKGKAKNIKSNVDDVDLSIHGSCRQSVKLVLELHQKYWKFAEEKLKEYEDIKGSEDKEETKVIGFDEWIDQNAAKIKPKVKDMSMFFIQITLLKHADNDVEWINLVHEWHQERLKHEDDFEKIWPWLAEKLNVETVE